MEDTYTYTARSAVNPQHIVTFTLHDHSLSIEPGAPVEQIDRLIQALENDQETSERTLTREDAAWLKPVGASLLQRRFAPFDLADIDARAKGDGFWLTAWIRTKGLRLAPIVFSMREVDNPAAAQGFVEELTTRRNSGPSAGRMPGLLDYWATWTALALSSLVVVAVWRYRRAPAEAATS